MACHCCMPLCYGGGVEQHCEVRVQCALHLSFLPFFSMPWIVLAKKCSSTLLEFHSTSRLGVILQAYYERPLGCKILKLFQKGSCVVSLCSIVNVMAWMA